MHDIVCSYFFPYFASSEYVIFPAVRYVFEQARRTRAHNFGEGADLTDIRSLCDSLERSQGLSARHRVLQDVKVVQKKSARHCVVQDVKFVQKPLGRESEPMAIVNLVSYPSNFQTISYCRSFMVADI